MHCPQPAPSSAGKRATVPARWHQWDQGFSPPVPVWKGGSGVVCSWGWRTWGFCCLGEGGWDARVTLLPVGHLGTSRGTLSGSQVLVHHARGLPAPLGGGVGALVGPGWLHGVCPSPSLGCTFPPGASGHLGSFPASGAQLSLCLSRLLSLKSKGVASPPGASLHLLLHFSLGWQPNKTLCLPPSSS